MLSPLCFCLKLKKRRVRLKRQARLSLSKKF